MKPVKPSLRVKAVDEQPLEKAVEGEEVSYFIDLTRFNDANRSFNIMLHSRLCSKCQQRTGAKLGRQTPEKLLSMIKGCCSKLANFITPKMPVSEKLFRIFLASGNQPLKVTELAARLAACSEGSFSLSESFLKRLLDNDQYYGFNQYSVPNFEIGKDSSIG